MSWCMEYYKWNPNIFVFFFFLWQCRNINKTYNCIYNVIDIYICLGTFIKFFVKLVDSRIIFTPQKILNSIFNWLYISLQLQSKIIVKVKAKLLKQKSLYLIFCLRIDSSRTQMTMPIIGLHNSTQLQNYRIFIIITIFWLIGVKKKSDVRK